jgi:hypothetical protein
VVGKTSVARKRGLAGDRFSVELRGRQYFVIDVNTGMVFGGPFPDRVTAQEKADALERNLGWRR